MIPRTLDELQTPDQLTLAFSPDGLGVDRILTPEAAVEFNHQVLAHCDLVERVPRGVQDSFENLRTVYMYGVLSYRMFTVASELARLVIEQAFRARFMEYFGTSVSFVNEQGERRTHAAASYEEIAAIVRKIGRSKGNWRLQLHRDNTLIPFKGGLTSLWKWAQCEGLLPGQRARLLQPIQVQLRNTVAHRTRDSLNTPFDAARVISDLAEIINCLWGCRTPGGRLHPAPVRRDVLAISWDDHERIETQRAETMVGIDLREDVPCIWVRAVNDGSFEPWEFHAQYETTVYPAELLWGPGTMHDARSWYEVHRPEGDEVDQLDRLFLFRHVDGRLEPPRSPDVAAGLEAENRSGEWHLVRADDPLTANSHLKQVISHSPGCSRRGPCEQCAADSIGHGTWHQVMDLLQAYGVTATPTHPPAVGVPSQFPSWVAMSTR